MTNIAHSALYTGVTTNLAARVFQHRRGEGGYFTSKYRCTKLVYVEDHADISRAIAREKQIKGGSRADKVRLIEELNPEWRDPGEEYGLFEEEAPSYRTGRPGMGHYCGG